MVPSEDTERTYEELVERARELDIKGRSSMNKADLEKAVSEAETQNEEGPVHPSAEEPSDLGTGRGEEETEEQPSVQASQEERVRDEKQVGLPKRLPSEVGPEDEIKPGEPGPNPQRSRPVREDAEMEA